MAPEPKTRFVPADTDAPTSETNSTADATFDSLLQRLNGECPGMCRPGRTGSRGRRSSGRSRVDVNEKRWKPTREVVQTCTNSRSVLESSTRSRARCRVGARSGENQRPDRPEPAPVREHVATVASNHGGFAVTAVSHVSGTAAEFCSSADPSGSSAEDEFRCLGKKEFGGEKPHDASRRWDFPLTETRTRGFGRKWSS